MLAFPEMLIAHAEAAGIKVPEDVKNYDKEQFPHWEVYCNAQLGRPIIFGRSHVDNASVIASIPESEIRQVTFAQLNEQGFV
jgi:hypothetical protein